MTEVVAQQAVSDSRRFGAAALGAPPPYVEPGPEPAGPVTRRRWVRIVRVLVPIVVAVVLIVVALFGGRAWGRHGTTRVWLATHNLAAGSALTAGDLRAVTATGAAADGAVHTNTPVVGRVLARSLGAGQLVLNASLGAVSEEPTAGHALVGVGLAAGNGPTQVIEPGDDVAVLELPAAPPGGLTAKLPPAAYLLRSVPVVALTDSTSGSVVTLSVPVSAVPGVTALSAAGRIALVRVPQISGGSGVS